MLPNDNNPQLWFAWYPVRTPNAVFPIRWLTEVWWFVEPSYRAHGRGLYTAYVNCYHARGNSQQELADAETQQAKE